VPEIRGTAQREGGAFEARAVQATVDSTGTALTLDLAPAYPREDIRQWRRTARLDRTTGRVRVTDEWDLLDVSDGRGPTTLRWLIAGEVRVEPGRAEITARQGAGTVVLTWEPGDAPWRITERVLDDPMLSDVWGGRLTRLDIDVTASGPKGAMVVTLATASAPQASLEGEEQR
jgi:hypothetical protein